MNVKRDIITVYFGVFGTRNYHVDEVIDGPIQIPCRWCIGEGEKTSLGCNSCKQSGRMWVSL